jgi:hypothetical protein
MRWTLLLLAVLGLGAATARPLAAQAWEDYDYENLEFRGVGVDLGWMLPPRVDAALLLGLRVDLGYLGPNVRIRPGMVFWASDMRQGEIDRLSDQLRNVCLRQRELPSECPALDLGRIRMSDLAFNLDAQYEWTDTPLLFIPYLGAGAGIHLLNGRGTAINGTFIEDFLDSISPSINVLGGARIPLTSALELNAEARYVLASEIRHAAFTVGAAWLIGPRGTPAAR